MSTETPRIVGTRSIFKGWNTLDVVTIEARDTHGRVQRLDREVVDHGDTAAVLAIDRQRNVAILVRQWRAALVVAGADCYPLEACAGLLDEGETPEDAARREAAEEIGFKLGELRKIGTIWPSPGALTERVHLFIAEVSADDRTEAGGGDPDEGEDIEIVETPLPRLFEMARRGEIVDAKTLVLVQRLMIEDLARNDGISSQ